MAELSENILKYLSENESVNTVTLAKVFQEDHQKIIGALKSIQAHGNLVEALPQNDKFLELTTEGKEIADTGSHEAKIFNAIPDDGIQMDQLLKIPNAKVGFSKAMSAKWILLDKSGKAPIVKRKVSKIVDTVQANLKLILSGHASQIADNVKQEYKSRKLLQEVQKKSFNLTKGPEFSLNLIKLETDLTSDMLQSGNWKNLKYKDYNFDALGAPLEAGYLHPLLKVRAEFRQIFLEMGFSEMPTNNFVESSFWNFDALFVPQQHPARDAHDTFFVSDPKNATTLPEEYKERVRQVHSVGGYGSAG